MNNITNILSTLLISMDEMDYNRNRRGTGERNKYYERKRRMKYNYTETSSFNNRYPAVSSQFMRR